MSTSRFVLVMVGIASLTLLPGPWACADSTADLATLIADQPTAPALQPPAALAPEQSPRGRGAGTAAPADDKGPPLPFQTIEGYGGGGITPFAYLVNPGKEELLLGKPATALTYIDARREDLDAVTASETLFGRLEFSYGGDRLGLGTLPADIRTATHTAIDEDSVLAAKLQLPAPAVEGERLPAGIKAPAITAGVSLKYNADISNINRELGGPERHRLSTRFRAWTSP